MASVLEQTRALSTPRVLVDGVVVAVLPNSVKKKYPGETKVRAVSAGGNAVQTVAGVNAEEMKGMVGFALANTKANDDRVRDWRDRSNRGVPVTIRLVDDTYQEAWSQMYMTSSPEMAFEAEGKIELEFEGTFVP